MKFTFKSISDFYKIFKDEKSCYDYLEEFMWGENRKCPHCESEKFYQVKQRGKLKDMPSYRCSNRECGLPFNVRTGTIFEGSHLELQKWFLAIYEMTICKKGISSYELAEKISVSQKTAWLLMHKIRKILSDNKPEMLDESVEVDETFVGGKNKNRHHNKKVHNNQGRSFKDKTPVFGILKPNTYGFVPDEDGVARRTIIVHSKIKCFVVRDTSARSIKPIIFRNVEKGSTIISDEWTAYNGLRRRYIHEVVDHGMGQYVNKKGYSSNGVENAWSHFKRSITGVHHTIKRKHLQHYCNEFALRFNQRANSVCERFESVINDGKCYSVTYQVLTANLPPAVRTRVNWY